MEALEEYNEKNQKRMKSLEKYNEKNQKRIKALEEFLKDFQKYKEETTLKFKKIDIEIKKLNTKNEKQIKQIIIINEIKEITIFLKIKIYYLNLKFFLDSFG